MPLDELLVRFGGKDDQRSPGACVGFGQVVVQQVVGQLVDDLAFMRAVARDLTADRRGVASVDSEGEATNVLSQSSCAEDVPEFLDEVGDGWLVLCGTALEVESFGEFCLVDGWVKQDDVLGRSRWEFRWIVSDGLPVILVQEFHAVKEVRAEVGLNVLALEGGSVELVFSCDGAWASCDFGSLRLEHWRNELGWLSRRVPQ